MKTASKANQVKTFARIHGLKISPGTKNGITIYRNGIGPDGISWIDVFDNWDSVFDFFLSEKRKIEQNKVPKWNLK